MPVTRSFENVEYWLDEVEKYAGPNVVKVRLLLEMILLPPGLTITPVLLTIITDNSNT